MRREASATGTRIAVVLACSECKARNYRTTKQGAATVVDLRKFCKTCKKHTAHSETK